MGAVVQDSVALHRCPKCRVTCWKAFLPAGVAMLFDRPDQTSPDDARARRYAITPGVEGRAMARDLTRSAVPLMGGETYARPHHCHGPKPTRRRRGYVRGFAGIN